MKIEKILNESDSLSISNIYFNNCSLVPSDKMQELIDPRFLNDLIKSNLFKSKTYSFLLEINAPEILTGLSDTKNKTLQKWFLWDTLENPKTQEPSLLFVYYNFFMKRLHFEKNFLLDQIAFLTIIENKLGSEPEKFNENSIPRINGFNFNF